MACALTTHVMVGTARPPIDPAQVTVYSNAPPVYAEIAVLSASINSVFNAGGQRTTDKVVERLKAEAAKLGANGLLLGDFEQARTVSIGTGVGSESYSQHGSVALGLGGAFGVFKTTGQARAIHVPPR